MPIRMYIHCENVHLGDILNTIYQLISYFSFLFQDGLVCSLCTLVQNIEVHPRHWPWTNIVPASCHSSKGRLHISHFGFLSEKMAQN